MDQLPLQHLLSAALPSLSKEPPSSPALNHAANSGSRRPRSPWSPPPAPLLSQNPPVSIPLLTVAFRRFIVKTAPLFYIQDRVEEVVLWRRGIRVSLTWMAAWAGLCYYPRLFLLVPHLVLISIILNRTVNPSSSTQMKPTAKSNGASSSSPADAAPGPTSGGGQDWQANLQGIQNLMLFYSDLFDALSSSILAKHLGAVPIPPPDEDDFSTNFGSSSPGRRGKLQKRRTSTDSMSSLSSPSKSALFTSPPSLTKSPPGSPISSPRSSTFGFNLSFGSDANRPKSPSQTAPVVPVETGTPTILPLLLITLPLPVLVTYIIPIRLLLLVAGWGPILLGHPHVRELATKLVKVDSAPGVPPPSSPKSEVGLGLSQDSHASPFDASITATAEGAPATCAASSPQLSTRSYAQLADHVRREGTGHVLRVVKELSSVDGPEEQVYGHFNN